MCYFRAMVVVDQLTAHIAEFGLPGETAHRLLAPKARVQTSQAKTQPNFNPRMSAVLVLLYPHEGELRNVLIRRPEYQGTHSGQIAFPGGKQEPEDVDLVETALREAEEEVGVTRNSIEVISALSEVYIPPSNFLVHPHLAFTTERPDFVADQLEVAEIVEYPVSRLLDPDVLKPKKIQFSNGFVLDTMYFDIHGHVVWGATAMMLSELRVLLEKVQP